MARAMDRDHDGVKPAAKAALVAQAGELVDRAQHRLLEQVVAVGARAAESTRRHARRVV